MQVEASTAKARFDKAMALQASLFDWQSFVDPVLKRQFSKIVEIGAAILPEDDYTRVSLHAYARVVEVDFIFQFKQDLGIKDSLQNYSLRLVLTENSGNQETGSKILLLFL